MGFERERAEAAVARVLAGTDQGMATGIHELIDAMCVAATWREMADDMPRVKKENDFTTRENLRLRAEVARLTKAAAVKRAHVIALPTYDLESRGYLGDHMERQEGNCGDWVSADDLQELFGFDPTDPEQGGDDD